MKKEYINGKHIKHLKRLDENTIELKMKNGAIIHLKAIMVDIDECELKDVVIKRSDFIE